MGKTTGFLEIRRRDPAYAPVGERVQHFHEFSIPLSEEELQDQGARCMDCGIPFCHSGCPLHNLIPDWNHLTYRGHWHRALQRLLATNNFPEFTGRVCPAPCEASCTLNLQDAPVAIRTIEAALADRGWKEGWITPEIPPRRTGKQVAVVGSGPAGLACAQQLARAGHNVVVFEKRNQIGGLLRYGIPDFKLDPGLIDRRVAQMQAEGVEFRRNTVVGKDIRASDLLTRFDAVILAAGCEQPRDLDVPGRDADGVHFAMDFLSQQKQRSSGEAIAGPKITAEGKRVLVIGGGDTGADCVGTAVRQGAQSVTQIEIMPCPPSHEDKLLSWPNWPHKLRTSTSHEEGCERLWSVGTKAFDTDQTGHVRGLRAVHMAWQSQGARWQMAEVAGSEFDIPTNLVLLAMGFVHPIHPGLLEELNVDLDTRGNVLADTPSYQTSLENVFAAGDQRRGQSLVVWAIHEGRECARAVDEYLRDSTTRSDSRRA